MTNLPGSSRITNPVRRGDAQRIAKACRKERSSHRADMVGVYAVLFWVLVCLGITVNWIFT